MSTDAMSTDAMSTDATPPNRFIGCDVGKHSVTVFDTVSGAIRSLPNRKPELRRFACGLAPDCLVVCEATGGHEARLLEAMLAAGRAVHRADARKVKAFIRSLGILGKSDAIDAKALAQYGAERHAVLPRWQAPDRARAEVQALVSLRIDLVQTRQAQRNRLAAPGAGAIAALLRPVLRAVEAQIRAVEQKIAALLEQQPALARAFATLCTIPGVGKVTATALLAMMPELGHLSGRAAAALAGVAPHPRESGTRTGYRRTRGGRPEVKRTLFMSALVASRAKGCLAQAYQRMIQRGKKPIVAITALMRKIIVIANAKLRDERQAKNNPIQVS